MCDTAESNDAPKPFDRPMSSPERLTQVQGMTFIQEPYLSSPVFQYQAD